MSSFIYELRSVVFRRKALERALCYITWRIISMGPVRRQGDQVKKLVSSHR